MNLESTQTLLTGERPDAPDHACLILIHGGMELGKRYELTKDVTIGREAANDICLDLQFISRQHARVSRRGDGWFIADLGSRNGTQINGQLIDRETPLHNGDHVKVGGAIFKYVAGGNIEALFHEEIYRMTIFDALTGVHNKRYLLDFVDREIARARRFKSPLSLAMVDIDHFKSLNDTYGHQAGDSVLERVAQCTAKMVRREQLVARYGGEEFSLVLPELEPDQVRAFCEAIRSGIEAQSYEFEGSTLKVTVSIGVAPLTATMERDDLFQAADAQLYESKRNGRNRVSIAS